MTPNLKKQTLNLCSLVEKSEPKTEAGIQGAALSKSINEAVDKTPTWEGENIAATEGGNSAIASSYWADSAARLVASEQPLTPVQFVIKQIEEALFHLNELGYKACINGCEDIHDLVVKKYDRTTFDVHFNKTSIKMNISEVIDMGFNPVGYTLEGRTIVVFDPADIFKELHTVPSGTSLRDYMYSLEQQLTRHLLATKQYQYIKREWVSKIPQLDDKSTEMIDVVDRTCLHCNRGIPAGEAYWVHSIDQLDEPDIDYLVYCMDCIQPNTFENEDEEWKHADDN